MELRNVHKGIYWGELGLIIWDGARVMQRRRHHKGGGNLEGRCCLLRTGSRERAIENGCDGRGDGHGCQGICNLQKRALSGGAEVLVEEGGWG